jgi:hypothetical protein
MLFENYVPLEEQVYSENLKFSPIKAYWFESSTGHFYYKNKFLIKLKERNIMSERKDLLSVSYHSDDDTGMHHIGEIDFGVHSTLEPYIEQYGYEGVKEILSVLGHLAWEVKNCFFEIQNRAGLLNCKDVKHDIV